ncbi:Protein NRT1/ PTR FAMILY 5.2 [Camellia lanceoleosa]|uniref:Protein NRT1/ PTR FAMILY 5.2 n=1 Tax=Camellia lanceoleosa TaxID=1840588 RepID=A0ACC0HQ93_9ERIC|nr:Protein NRT1/ PTR FAMILY 5.2 [Camellia lanceoleosa]
MCLLTLAVSLPTRRPPSCDKSVNELDYDKWASKFQVGFFYCALYITALGTGDTKPNIFTMGADYLPTLGLGVSIVVFLVGTPYYRHKATSGSPLTNVARVLVAVMRKRKEVVPNDPKELYEVTLDQYNNSGKLRADRGHLCNPESAFKL